MTNEKNLKSEEYIDKFLTKENIIKILRLFHQWSWEFNTGECKDEPEDYIIKHFNDKL